MTLHIIATAYHKPLHLERLVRNFQVQTDKNWNMKVIHDGEPPEQMKAFFKSLKDPRVEFDYTKVVNGYWGHPNRGMMLNELKGDPNDYVLITNDDNQYVDMFVQLILQHCNPGVGMVFCDTVHNYMYYDVLHTQIRVGRIDMGSFIVRLDVAKKTGFVHTEAVADGIYAEECATECTRQNLKIIYVSKPLFIHN